jgi:hypothetical protein
MSEAETLVSEMHDDHLLSVAATLLRSEGMDSVADELEKRFGDRHNQPPAAGTDRSAGGDGR